MPRITDSSVLAAISAGSFKPALFVQMGFAGGVTAYVWSGTGLVTWNGQTWAGLGSFLGLATMEDGYTVEAKGTAITISGFDATFLPDVQGNYRLGAPCAIQIGIYSGGSLLPTPISAWVGRMDKPTIVISGDKATIQIAVESRLKDLNIPVDRRYTNQDQQMDWPQDLGMQFVDSIQEITTFWMQYPNNTNNV